MRGKHLWVGSSAFGLLLGAPTWAQDAPSTTGSAQSATTKAKPASAFHDSPASDIIVTARREKGDAISGVAVLQGVELTQSLRPTIGDTLARTPGVSATSFGPNASRPVLRGLQGERVRVLTDGIGSIDVSNTSVDHAVVIDSLLADRVEVLRGPEALLYTSGANGGVVNVIDKRIPRAIPDEPVHVDAIGTYGSAANERSVAAAADAPVGSKIVLHADGSYIKSGNLDIGGHVLSSQARQQALANAGTEDAGQIADGINFTDAAALKGTLANSSGKTWTAGVGAAIITDTGNFGIAYSHYASVYGVPIRYATAPGEGQEAPRLDLKQNRIDARGEVQTGGDILQAIRTRFAYASYRHFELEEDGSIGTAFYNKGLEGRLELVQAAHGAWTGTTGLQYFSRDFNVIGDEAFLPKNSTQQLGVFTLQQYDIGKLKLEAAARFEHSILDAQPTSQQPQFFDGSRRFDTVSASGGASYALSPDWRIGTTVSHTVRAPSAEELFANGPHGGTEAFEIGDPNLAEEKSWGVEAAIHGKGRGYTLEASVYQNWYKNFIYDDRTGAIEDGLPVYQNRQADARYYGFEVQGTLTLARFGEASITADGLADYVHAQIRSVGPAPRIPPLRTLTGITFATPKVDVRGEVEWVDHQQRIAAFETPTDGYTMVNAQVNIRPWGTARPLSFALSADNLFDVDARRAASFLKDFAPLAGRDFRITARASF